MRGATKQNFLEGNAFCRLIDMTAGNIAMARRVEKVSGGQES